jgi:hypothetical protein
MKDRKEKCAKKIMSAETALKQVSIFYGRNSCFTKSDAIFVETVWPVSIFEHLRDYLKAHPGETKKLNIKVACQRPCASRTTPEKDPLLDEIFAMIGVARVKRQYDGVNAICCGVELAGPTRKKR